ncbi:MAG: tetratricopeptide repeat protein, partial [Proteobacteria bacterium]|nr:tetratricopeptide repeat protein [Pseudomonadota bacterium]
MLIAGDSVGAESAFRSALQSDGDFAEAHANLGLLLDLQERWTEGEEHYRKALRLSPLQTQTYLNFGAMLMKQKRHGEAEAVFRKALAIDPDSPSAWSSLGVLLACIKEEEAAEYCYRSAMVIAPDYRKAGFNLAYLLLRQGRYQEGWTCFESRDWYTRLEERLMFPRWQGEALKGKALLIGFEAGHGDMIQFCRYATQTKRAGASRVAILCQPGLTSLFTRLSGVDETISIDGSWPSTGFDYWAPALSLPRLFGTTLDTIPAEVPYLSADPERIHYWADVIGPAGLRVGLVWKGNPRFENDADRSLPSLQTLSPLKEVEGVRYFSLQKTNCAEAAEGDSELPWLVNLG